MACQNHTPQVFDFGSERKTAFFPSRTEKLHGRSFSDSHKSTKMGREV
jgi:ferredoxin